MKRFLKGKICHALVEKAKWPKIMEKYMSLCLYSKDQKDYCVHGQANM